MPNRWQAIIWINDGLGWWRMYASLGLNELNYVFYHFTAWLPKACRLNSSLEKIHLCRRMNILNNTLVEVVSSIITRGLFAALVWHLKLNYPCAKYTPFKINTLHLTNAYVSIVKVTLLSLIKISFQFAMLKTKVVINYRIASYNRYIWDMTNKI